MEWGHNEHLEISIRVHIQNCSTHPCDIRGAKTVRILLQHIIAVELRYAERLNSERETPYEEIPNVSVDSLYALTIAP